MKKEESYIKNILNDIKPIVITKLDKDHFEHAKTCHICCRQLEVLDKKIIYKKIVLLLFIKSVQKKKNQA
jgi:hypothetical protein